MGPRLGIWTVLRDEMQYDGENGKILEHLLESAFWTVIDKKSQEVPRKYPKPPSEETGNSYYMVISSAALQDISEVGWMRPTWTI